MTVDNSINTKPKNGKKISSVTFFKLNLLLILLMIIVAGVLGAELVSNNVGEAIGGIIVVLFAVLNFLYLKLQVKTIDKAFKLILLLTPIIIGALLGAFLFNEYQYESFFLVLTYSLIPFIAFTFIALCIVNIYNYKHDINHTSGFVISYSIAVLLLMIPLMLAVLEG